MISLSVVNTVAFFSLVQVPGSHILSQFYFFIYIIFFLEHSLYIVYYIIYPHIMGGGGGGGRGRDHMVDGYTTTCAISAYQH